MSLVSSLADYIAVNTLTGTLGDSTGLSNIAIVFTGDSFAERLVNVAGNVTSFTDDLTAVGITLDRLVEAATSGGNLTETGGAGDDEYILLDGSKGALYTANLDTITNKDEITDIVLSEPVNDRVAFPSTVTKAQVKTAYENWLGFLRTDFPNCKRFHIMPATRHGTEDNQDRWLPVDQIINEIANEQSDCYILPEQYHLTLGDAIHLNDANELVYLDLIAKRISFVGGNGGNRLLCPELNTVTVVDDGFEIAITHKDGNDITVTGSSDNFMVLETDAGVYIADGYTLTRQNANTIKCTGTAIAGGNEILNVGGSMLGLAATDVAPVVPLDNSANTLPIRKGSVTFTDADTLRAKSRSVLKEGANKTYTTGTTIDTVGSLNGKTWINASTSLRFDYDTTAFSNLGGYQGTDDINSKLVTDHAWSAKNLFFGVVDIPAALGTGDHLHLFQGGTGTAAAPSFSSVIRFMVLASDGSLRYFNGQSAAVTFGGNYLNSAFVWCVDMHSVSDWDIYIHDGTTFTTIQTGFDPNDTYSTATIVAIGGGAKYGRHYFMNGDSTDNSINIETTMATLATTHGL